MLKTARKTSKRSPFFLFPFTILLIFLLSFSWVSAKEPPKPKPQPWQIDGIVAALDDGYPQVQKLAFDKLAGYEAQDLKAVPKKPEDIAQKAAKILKDKTVDSDVRASAASALGNLGDAAKPYVKDIADILKDKTVDSSVRSSAADALGNLGDAAKPYVKDIADILKDKTVDSSVRSSAADALGNLGDAAKPYVKDILDILKDKNVESNVRVYAASALGNLGDAAKPYVKDIADFLKDKNVDPNVRASAASALGNLGDAAKPYVKDIADFLKDKNVESNVRVYAASALGNLGDAAKPYVKDIADFLKDKNVESDVRASAASALGNLGDAAKPYVKDIADFLKDKNVESDVRASAASALGNLGDAAKPYVKDIADILKDKNVHPYYRASAASALGNLGDAAKPYVKDIADILKDKTVDLNVRASAASALGNLGDAAKPYVKDIADFLKDKNVHPNVRADAASALGNTQQLNLDNIVVILDSVYYAGQSEFEQWRFFTYFLSGGTDEVKTLLTWLGIPDSKTIPPQLNHDEGVKTLNVFKKAWETSNTQKLKRLQDDLAKQIGYVVASKKVSWKAQDIKLLSDHHNNLKKGGHNEADTVQSVINNLEGWKWFFAAKNTFIIHAAFWLALIFAYPKFPQVQAIFFWNPWVRRILGVGYVGFLLAWVPFLRRKLFEPFKFSLLADAGLSNFNSQAYFPQSRVKVPMTGEIREITHELPSIKGQIVLEGDSGLGKSMFLRYLVKSSQAIVVYLPAHKCDKGVIEAIQAKLHGQAQDAEFLKNLIYSGAIDICIDGLNEVTADTRAKITQFVESYFRGNIIMTTQPLEWIPPSTAKMYYLQPLERQQIEEFLISRQPRLPKDAKIQGTAYEQACKNYLTKAFNQQQSREELEAAQRTLSNPMDLTLVAQMLSQGKQPDLFRLQEQQYKEMAAEYLQEWKHEFPLKKFSEAVYQMRLNDEKALSGELFYQELHSMEDEKYKMVVSRQWQDEKGEAKKECYFRHDKIMDFFLVQTFLGDGDAAEQRLIDHMSDPRFRGVYFLLATLLHLDKAKALREELIQYAANTKDHTVSDTFVQLLRSR
ncbi:MAG: HEAT repeat domain-containing protein [Tolypothrix carrinoi HA7290-LM1]|jgi:HEAT repeat protein|nr:HEAT repeat domain-containing protein [Tolypothrix carrinoi HA7290-LM1]